MIVNLHISQKQCYQTIIITNVKLRIKLTFKLVTDWIEERTGRSHVSNRTPGPSPTIKTKAMKVINLGLPTAAKSTDGIGQGTQESSNIIYRLEVRSKSLEAPPVICNDEEWYGALTVTTLYCRAVLKRRAHFTCFPIFNKLNNFRFMHIFTSIDITIQKPPNKYNFFVWLLYGFKCSYIRELIHRNASFEGCYMLDTLHNRIYATLVLVVQYPQ